MLKKAGIIVAAAAAGLLAVGSFAFAGETDHERSDYSYSEETNEAGTSTGLVNVAENNTNTPLQACNNNIPVNGVGGQAPVEDITSAVAGAASVLGDSESESEVEADNSDTCGQGGSIDDTTSNEN